MPTLEAPLLPCVLIPLLFNRTVRQTGMSALLQSSLCTVSFYAPCEGRDGSHEGLRDDQVDRLLIRVGFD